METTELRNAARRRLDHRYASAAVSTEQLRARPHTGWVRAVRDALGMSTRQLATRMGVAQATVVQMERSEAYETIQLATLRRAADALDCDLIYALVPRNGSLQHAVNAQASRRAHRAISAVDRSMELEDQAVRDPQEVRASLERATLQLAASRRLWDA